ncbi:MAG: PSD1 and planctomycete cytochrome C domain-containing protein [Planctomycetota bacterium]
MSRNSRPSRCMMREHLWIFGLLLNMVPLQSLQTVHAEDKPVRYATDIRPLLSNMCFACHGPDEATREADLRLDQSGSATEDLGGYSAIVPGSFDESEVWVRISSDDPDLVMPPPETGMSLDDTQRDLIRRWIGQGAEYEKHWAFQPPKKRRFQADDASDVIDKLIKEKLSGTVLRVNPPADRRTLLRRLCLDVIGLPPLVDDVERLVESNEPEDLSNYLETLLSSQHYGERWARVWLDAARYADSDGFEKDKPRFVHFYRDWVINAFNENLPYDEFIVKQIAGDLLPSPSQDDLVATGFLRNSMINEEGGVDPEQFRMEAMYDRMDAIGKSVLGMTVQCAQCHSHKYDPISHTDYYSMFAFLNDSHEACMTVYTDKELADADQTQAMVLAARQETLNAHDSVQRDFLAWMKATKDALERQVDEAEWTIPELDFIEETVSGQKFLRYPDGSYLGQGYSPSRAAPQADMEVDMNQIRWMRLELLRDPNLPHGGPGRSIDGTWALSEVRLQYRRSRDNQWKTVSFDNAEATIHPDKERLQPRYHFKKPDPNRVSGDVSFLIDNDEKTAWRGDRGVGRRNEPQTAWLKLAEPIHVDGSAQLRVTLAQRHGGWNSDDNHTHNIGRFRLGLTSDSIEPIAVPSKLREKLVSVQDLKQLDEETFGECWEFFVSTRPELQFLDAEMGRAWKTFPYGTSQLVLRKRDEARTTYRLERGDFLSPREEVAPATPAFLHPIESRKSGQPDRLDFARWLVDDRSPTAARSIVNRIWQEYFGSGITATSDDFGMQGEPPVNQELLDWLAVDLMEHDWDLKHLHRSIVGSEVYRQSTKVHPEDLEHDPSNRLLARGARYRASAEVVRDVALAASGLLNPVVGGKPVFPQAPMFLFEPPNSYGPKSWLAQSDASQYRRAIYTFRFRSVPYPAMAAFDAPTGEVSCVRRGRSNTPLQALVSLNEPIFLQCAIELGHAAMCVAQSHNTRAGIDEMFLRCMARTATDKEVGLLEAMFNRRYEQFTKEPSQAEKLLANRSPIGSYDKDFITWASYATIARVILNLDETISKP